MDARNLKITLFLIIVLSIALPAQAQTALTVLIPVTGTVPADSSNAWTFNAQNGAVLSFALETQSKSFDAAMTLTDSSGHEVVSSDDFNYPDSLNPLLEAITMPRTDTYTLTVSSVNHTSGAYTLTMLPGYSVSSYDDDFSSSQWRALDATLTAQQSDGQLALSSPGTHQTGVAFNNNAKTVGEFYAQAQVVSVLDPAGWVVGMAVRRQSDSYYLLSINSQGNWRFTLTQSGTEHVIHDWTPHPNIVHGATSFTIAVLGKGSGFDFFYNSGYIGSESDATLSGAGQIGLTVGAFSSAPSQSSATFDNLHVTIPVQVNGADVIPQEVQAGDGNQMVLTLRRTNVVAAGGQMALTIPDSSVQYVHPGINRVMFGRGTQYGNFALGTTVDLSAAGSGPAGCGLVFRFSDETDYSLAW